MTTYRCRKCPAKADGTAQYHPGTWACPKEATWDAGKTTKWEERRAQAKDVMKKGLPTPPGTAPVSPAPAAEKSGILKSVELGSAIAETERRDASQKKAETDWLLPEDSALTFFETIRNGFRTFAHWLDDMLDAEKTKEGKIKDGVFEMNSHEMAAAKGGFGRRLATKAVKAMGARTMEEGIATVDSLAFVMMFGTMLMLMVGHFWKVAEESPRLKKLRDSVAKKREENEERKRLKAEKAGTLTDEAKRRALTVEGKAMPPGTAKGAPG